MATERMGQDKAVERSDDQRYQTYCGCDERTFPFWGVLLIALGSLWLLDRTNAIDWSVGPIVGPVLLVAWGISMLWSARMRGQLG